MQPARLPLVLLQVLVGCGAAAPSATPPQSNVSVTAPVVTVIANDNPPEWDRLVERELVWRRPDMDVGCGPSESAFFVRNAAPDEALSTALPSELGCRLPESAVSGATARPEFLGTTCCCPRSRSTPMPHTAGAPSCEQAVEDYRRAFRDTDSEPPPSDSSAAQYASILNRGSYFKHCAVPDTTGLEICAAVINGNVVGVTVRTQPAAPSHADCVAAAVLQLAFPPNVRMDVARTQF